jgi:spermidine synthase/dTDP-glucose pyrophosphorylase
MKALILAGGFARRLGPIGERLPKAVLPTEGDSVLNHLLRKLERVGLEAFVSTNKRFEPFFRQYKNVIVEEATSEEQKLGAVSAINYAIKKIGINEDLLVACVDNYFSSGLDGFIKSYEGVPQVGIYHVGARPDMKAEEMATVKFEGSDIHPPPKDSFYIKEFKEKVKPPLSQYVSMGVYLLPKRVFPILDEFCRMKKQDAPGFFIQHLLERGEKLKGHIFPGEWYDIAHKSYLIVFKEGKLLESSECCVVVERPIGDRMTLSAVATHPGRQKAGNSPSAAVLFFVAVLQAHTWDRYMLNTGFFDSPRYALHQVSEKGFRDFVRSYDIRYYEEETYANVAVSYESENLFLQINGRTEASTTADMSNQILVAQIPMLVHPDPREVLVVGLGSGITLGSVLTHPVDRAECVEISPAVVRAAAFFREWHDDVTKNPKAEIILDDARNYLLASRRKYDIIVSEPSKPWISGVSNLFTREFYEICRKRLKPGGILCQWFHYYSMNPEDFRITLRTFLGVFPYAQIWNADNNVFLLGSEEPIRIDVQRMEERMTIRKVAADLGRIEKKNPYVLLGNFLFGEEEARQYVGEGRINTDDLPIIEFSTPRHRDEYRHEEILESMLNAFPRYDAYPLVGHIAEEGNTINFRLGNFRFTSPIDWQSGAATMVRSVVPGDRFEDAEGPFIAYRLEASMLGAKGEELRMVALTRGAFSDERLKMTVERLSRGERTVGKGTVEGQAAYWSAYRQERPGAALSWHFPPNKLQYLLQLVGPEEEDPEHLKDLLLEGASCSEFIGYR